MLLRPADRLKEHRILQRSWPRTWAVGPGRPNTNGSIGLDQCPAKCSLFLHVAQTLVDFGQVGCLFDRRAKAVVHLPKLVVDLVKLVVRLVELGDDLVGKMVVRLCHLKIK